MHNDTIITPYIGYYMSIPASGYGLHICVYSRRLYHSIAFNILTFSETVPAGWLSAAWLGAAFRTREYEYNFLFMMLNSVLLSYFLFYLPLIDLAYCCMGTIISNRFMYS